MASKSPSKPYFLLKDRQEIDDELLNSLLGLAVTNPSRPIQPNHRARSPLKARDAFNFLYPPEYLACDSHALGEIMGKKESKKIQAFVNASLKPNQEPVMIRRFSMRDAGDKLGKLLEELSVPEGISTQDEGTVFDADEASRGEIQRVKRAQYRKEVFDLLLAQPDGKLAVITSFLTCFPLWENRERFYKDISTYTQYPVEPGTQPILVGIDVGSQYSPTLDAGTLGAYKGECLIACSYQHVYLDPKAKKRRVPFFDIKLGSITTWASSRLSSKRPERGAPEDSTYERSEVSSLGSNDKSEIILSETDEDEGDDEFTFSLLYRDSLESDLYARSLRGK